MDDISKAITILSSGGIVIFPTDTAFGIGCRIDDGRAVKRLFELRKRPETKATPVLVSSIAMAQKYYASPPPSLKLPPSPKWLRRPSRRAGLLEEIKKLMTDYWPGGLTIVYYANTAKIPKLVRGGTDTIGLRMPNHEVTVRLIKEVGVPLLGPSANFHGAATPFKYKDLDPQLMKLVDFVLPGECTVKQASTVIDCTQEPWKILRQGSVRVKMSS